MPLPQGIAMTAPSGLGDPAGARAEPMQLAGQCFLLDVTHGQVNIDAATNNMLLMWKPREFLFC